MIRRNLSLKDLYDESIQFAVIQAFFLKDKFEQMVVMLIFRQRMKKNDNIYHVCIKSTLKA